MTILADAAQIVEIARDWVGTPYLHQGSLRGVGTDCLGLIRGVWRGLYGAEPRTVPPYTRDWSEPAGDEQLLTAARALMSEVGSDAVRPGDVVIFRMRRDAVAKHLGIVSDWSMEAGAFVHSYDRVGVVESPLSAAWRRRIAGVFRFP